MLDQYGLLSTLRWCGELCRGWLDLQVDVSGEKTAPPLPAAVAMALFCVAQEAREDAEVLASMRDLEQQQLTMESRRHALVKQLLRPLP